MTTRAYIGVSLSARAHNQSSSTAPEVSRFDEEQPYRLIVTIMYHVVVGARGNAVAQRIRFIDS